MTRGITEYYGRVRESLAQPECRLLARLRRVWRSSFVIAVKPLRQCVLASACLCICLISALFAQRHAPLPEKLISAQRIYLINDSGDLKAYDKFFSELKKWGRFTIGSRRSRRYCCAYVAGRIRCHCWQWHGCFDRQYCHGDR